MRVLFVSKPIVPPWNDGSKNLVRDIATHLVRAEPTVFVTPNAPQLAARVRTEAVYRHSGSFAPGLLANARVMRRLLSKDAHDIWHFVFAPNPASVTAARIACLRFRGAVVQTVASRPKSDHAALIFGDHVIALSEWMRGRLIGAGISASRIRVIPPCTPRPRPIEPSRIARIREQVGSGPIVLYPGDYEVSSGARTVVDAVPLLAKEIPEVRVVLACREKSPRAREARKRLEAKDVRYTHHLGEVEDMPALLAASSVVVFPVDDLLGKVDLPLVVLEALSMGIPLVLARGGPLEAIACARFVDPGDATALARETVSLLRQPSEGGAAFWERHFSPERVARLHDDLYDEIHR